MVHFRNIKIHICMQILSSNDWISFSSFWNKWKKWAAGSQKLRFLEISRICPGSFLRCFECENTWNWIDLGCWNSQKLEKSKIDQENDEIQRKEHRKQCTFALWFVFFLLTWCEALFLFNFSILKIDSAVSMGKNENLDVSQQSMQFINDFGLLQNPRLNLKN